MNTRDYQVTEQLSAADQVPDPVINLPFDVLHEGLILQCNPMLPDEVIFKDREVRVFKAQLINNQC